MRISDWSSDVCSSDLLKAGANEPVVEVTDPTSAGMQPRGKQILDPAGIWYTAVSGIWQTVWIEPVPKLHIAEVRATPDIDRGTVDVAVALSGWANDTDAVRLTARAGGQPIGLTPIRDTRNNRRTASRDKGFAVGQV